MLGSMASNHASSSCASLRRGQARATAGTRRCAAAIARRVASAPRSGHGSDDSRRLPGCERASVDPPVDPFAADVCRLLEERWHPSAARRGSVLACSASAMPFILHAAPPRFVRRTSATRSAASLTRNPIFGWLASMSIGDPCSRSSSDVVGPDRRDGHRGASASRTCGSRPIIWATCSR